MCLFGCLRKGGFSVEVCKGSLAVGERFGATSQHPGIEPSVGRVEGLEPFNRLEPSLQMGIE